MADEAIQIGPERIMSPGELISFHPQSHRSFDTWHVYSGVFGKVEYEMIAQQIVSASKEAGMWVILKDFNLVTPSDLERMIRRGLLCKVEYPVYLKVAQSGRQLAHDFAYMLTHNAIVMLAAHYPAKM